MRVCRSRKEDVTHIGRHVCAGQSQTNGITVMPFLKGSCISDSNIMLEVGVGDKNRSGM